MASNIRKVVVKKSKKLVVAVDDSGIILKMIGKVLGERYEYHAFSSGKRALAFLQDRTPDVIILDIAMPEMDGYEMLKRIRSKEYLGNVPVIFLTSNADKEHVIKAIEGGANDYVIKPIDEDILLDKVRGVIKDDENDAESDEIIEEVEAGFINELIEDE